MPDCSAPRSIRSSARHLTTVSLCVAWADLRCSLAVAVLFPTARLRVRSVSRPATPRHPVAEAGLRCFRAVASRPATRGALPHYRHTLPPLYTLDHPPPALFP